jgi:CheY-like chemotaxis protein
MTRGKRILVVEDHAPSRVVLKKLFAQHGWDVVTAGTVAEALAALEDGPDCAIVDLNLPDREGEGVLEAIWSRLRQTGAIVITADDDAGRLRHIRERFRPAGVFLKPLTSIAAFLEACDRVAPVLA